MQKIHFERITEVKKRINNNITSEQENKELKEKIENILTKKLNELQEIKGRKPKVQEQKIELQFQENDLRNSQEEVEEKLKNIDILERKVKEKVQERNFDLQLKERELKYLPTKIAQLEEDLENIKQSLESVSKDKNKFLLISVVLNIAFCICSPTINIWDSLVGKNTDKVSKTV